MPLRALAPATQRSYLHYVADFAKFYNTSPDRLDLEAVRLLHERKLSPESINSFVSAVQFLFLVTLEMPWGKECFPRVRRPDKLPVVLSPEEVSRFLENIGHLNHRAALMLCYGAGLRISEAVAVKNRRQVCVRAASTRDSCHTSSSRTARSCMKSPFPRSQAPSKRADNRSASLASISGAVLNCTIGGFLAMSSSA
jgi:site-specific recombinase XerC